MRRGRRIVPDVFHMAWIELHGADPEPIGLFVTPQAAEEALEKVKELTGSSYGRVWHFSPESYVEWLQGTFEERFGHLMEDDDPTGEQFRMKQRDQENTGCDATSDVGPEGGA